MRGMTIARNLPRLRKEKGMSQVELAKKAGVSQQLVSRLESGVDLTSKKLPELARALEVSVDELDRNYLPKSETAPIRCPDEIKGVLERIVGLTDDNVTTLLAVVNGFIEANTARQARPAPDDQSAPATPRRESQSSR